MTHPLRVLHLEDSPRDAEMVRHRLDDEGLSCDILLANSKDSFEAALTREPFDLILSDYNLPGYDGVAALKQAQAAQPDVPVILISGTVVDEVAVKVLHIGATDYLLKDRLDRLVPAVQRALREAETRRRRQHTEQALVQREQALRDNEERTNFALAAARMGVWEIEFASNRLTWSDTMAPLFGLTPDHAPKTTAEFFQLIHPDDRRATEASVDRAIAGERDYVVEFRALWPDGRAHWVHGRAQASYDADGKPLRLGHLPIVAMTAYAMPGDAARCLASGMDAYLSKPIQPDELFDAVERHISSVPVSRATFSPKRAEALCDGGM
jgi:PAS domain S-box-containing protein